jgi:hypothetical protein
VLVIEEKFVNLKLTLFLILGALTSFSTIAGPFDEKEYKIPLREISIIATKDGFFPNKIMAYQGEKIKFFITSTVETGQCFILQKHEVFISAERGRVSEGETILDNAGRFKFYCPANKSVGYLKVFKKFNAEENSEVKRDIASEKKSSHWMPRDYD